MRSPTGGIVGLSKALDHGKHVNHCYSTTSRHHGYIKLLLNDKINVCLCKDMGTFFFNVKSASVKLLLRTENCSVIRLGNSLNSNSEVVTSFSWQRSLHYLFSVALTVIESTMQTRRVGLHNELLLAVVFCVILTQLTVGHKTTLCICQQFCIQMYNKVLPNFQTFGIFQ